MLDKADNIRKFIRKVLNEYITSRDLKNVENYADDLFSDVGVDVEFTKHFLDRVNDIRNKQDITPEELKWLYQKAYDRYSNMISKLNPGEERVLTDPDTQINIPVVIAWDGRSPDKEMVGKTVMRKKDFKSYTPKLALEESIGRIRKTKLNGTYYHGTSVGSNDDLFSEFNPGHSDWDAVWFASDENISEEFAENSYRDDNEIKAVYEVSLKCNAIADIDYVQAEEIKNQWGLYDFRESIPILKQKGFNGWKTTGSIGYNVYDDIAIFNLNCAKIIGVKLFIDDNWTDYMPLSEAQGIIDSKRVSVDEDINVPINVGDEVLGGKFKNKKIIVKDIGKNEKGDITINDKPLLRFRITKESFDDRIKWDTIIIEPAHGDKHTNIQLNTKSREKYFEMRSLFHNLKNTYPELKFFLQGDSSSENHYWLMFEPWSSDEDKILEAATWLSKQLKLPIDIHN